MKMKDWKLLLIYAVIGIAMAGITGRSLCQKHWETDKKQASRTFGLALEDELQKWKGVNVKVFLSEDRKLPDKSIGIKKDPVEVKVNFGQGMRSYVIPYEKHAQNIERNSTVRGMHSYLLHQAPLNADSLNLFWQERLADSGFSGKTVVRIVTTDWEERDSCAYSGDAFYLSQSDSLTTYYMGLRCEAGVTGYLYHPWWMTLSWKDWGLLAAIIAGCILLFFVQRNLYKLYCHLFVKEKQVVVEKEIVVEKQVQVPVFIEKEVPVTVPQKSGSHIYRLEEGVYFDADSRLLKKGDMTVNLKPQPARLLQGFLEAENCRLSNDEILHLLWPDGSGTQNKLYQIIKRLRESLSEISICTVENEKFAYQLKIPHSIEKNPI